MILLGYDVETTGVDKNNDEIIEIGLVLYSTAQNRILESTGFLVRPTVMKISEEIVGLTGITEAAANKFGYDPEFAIYELQDYAQKADYIIAHNGCRFDKPMTENIAKRLGITMPDKLWIDTMTDIPGVKGEQLITMCAKVGFLNPNAHGALSDAASTIEMARRHALEPAKNFDKIVERAQSPVVLLQSHQARGNNEDAKKLKFRWNPDHKFWWKPVKEMDIQELETSAPFKISRLDKTYSIEMLDN